MRINGFRCDACCKEHLIEPTVQQQNIVQGMPDAWFTLWHGKLENGHVPLMFCSLKCLSDWVSKQLIGASVPKEVVPEERKRWENW